MKIIKILKVENLITSTIKNNATLDLWMKKNQKQPGIILIINYRLFKIKTNKNLIYFVQLIINNISNQTFQKQQSYYIRKI